MKMSEFVRETLGMAVLDSVSSWTVAIKLWFDFFFDTLNDQDKYLEKTNKTFCFGDRVEVKSINSVKFLATRGRAFANSPGDRCSISGQVIPRTQKVVLDTSLLNYKVRFKGKVMQTRERSSY